MEWRKAMRLFRAMVQCLPTPEDQSVGTENKKQLRATSTLGSELKDLLHLDSKEEELAVHRLIDRIDSYNHNHLAKIAQRHSRMFAHLVSYPRRIGIALDAFEIQASEEVTTLYAKYIDSRVANRYTAVQFSQLARGVKVTHRHGLHCYLHANIKLPPLNPTQLLELQHSCCQFLTLEELMHHGKKVPRLVLPVPIVSTHPYNWEDVILLRYAMKNEDHRVFDYLYPRVASYRELQRHYLYSNLFIDSDANPRCLLRLKDEVPKKEMDTYLAALLGYEQTHRVDRLFVQLLLLKFTTPVSLRQTFSKGGEYPNQHDRIERIIARYEWMMRIMMVVLPRDLAILVYQY